MTQLREALTSLVRQYHAQNVNADERAHRLVHRPGSHLNCDDHFCRATTAALWEADYLAAGADSMNVSTEGLLAAALLDEGLLATALEGYEVVPYKPSTNDDYEEHRQGAAKVIAAAYRLAAYRASQERV